MKTILVVDDESSITGLLDALLTMEGYHVITASNGRDALEHLAGGTIHLVLSDIMMPIMRGDELCFAMQTHADYRSTPIILMSAVGESAIQVECAFTILIHKPFTIDTILNTVAGIFSRVS
jgi:two-component system, chemotaxis family, chemotaxis protein CheY